MKRNVTFGFTALAAAMLMGSLFPIAAHADHTRTHRMHMRMMHRKAVYTCPQCKAYYTPRQAMKMGYMDPMGHRLHKRMGVPAGYRMGSRMMNHGKMGNMHGNKMGGKM